MSQRLLRELKQRKPFGSLEEEALLELMRSASLVMREGEQFFASYGLTTTQYNVLRILRGAGPAGLACREIGERLVAPDPDVTRLLDRLEKRRLIARRRDTADRRVVLTVITPEGLDLLRSLDRPTAAMLERNFSAFSSVEIRRLIALLEKLRAPRSQSAGKAPQSRS
jgi:DNA-binding MarR family transcriptional regulator